MLQYSILLRFVKGWGQTFLIFFCLTRLAGRGAAVVLCQDKTPIWCALFGKRVNDIVELPHWASAVVWQVVAILRYATFTERGDVLQVYLCKYSQPAIPFGNVILEAFDVGFE